MPPRLNEASSLVAHGPVLLDYYTIRGSLFVKVRKSGVFPGKTGKIGDFSKGGPVPQPSSTVIGRPPGSSVFQRGQLFPCLALGVGGEEEAPGGAVDLVMIVNIADLVHGVPSCVLIRSGHRIPAFLSDKKDSGEFSQKERPARLHSAPGPKSRFYSWGRSRSTNSMHRSAASALVAWNSSAPPVMPSLTILSSRQGTPARSQVRTMPAASISQMWAP